MSRPLRQREYRLLFSGQVVSNLGDWLDFIALAVLIAYVWEMGPSALAGLSVAIAVPWIFLAPLSGVLVDRWPKKPVLIGSDLLRAVFVTGLIFAPNLGVLIVLVVAKTAVATFFQPAEQATIRIIVAEAQLHAANALTQLVQQSTKVIGPALGGLIVGIASPRVAFGVDAASFLLSALILSRMRPIDDPRAQREEDEDDEEGGYWAELREGIAYIAGRRTLVLAIVGLGATIFLLFSFDTLAPLAFQQLGVSRSLFGLTVAGIGLGGVLGAIAVGRYGGEANPFSLLGGGVSIVGCCVALIGFALVTSLDAPQWIWVPVLVVVGIASAGILVASPTIIQRETPAELMGRVSTSANAIPTGLQMFAPIAGAALAEWQSVGFVFSAAGAGLAGLGLVVLAIRPPVGVGVGVEPAAPPPEASSGSHAAAAPASTAGSAKDQDRASSARSHRNTTEVRMSDDLDILKSAGFNLDVLSAQEQEAVSNLSRDELETLAAIRTKLNAEPEVSGHARALAGDGNFVW